jgi:hypothetical protein
MVPASATPQAISGIAEIDAASSVLRRFILSPIGKSKTSVCPQDVRGIGNTILADTAKSKILQIWTLPSGMSHLRQNMQKNNAQFCKEKFRGADVIPCTGPAASRAAHHKTRLRRYLL